MAEKEEGSLGCSCKRGRGEKGPWLFHTPADETSCSSLKKGGAMVEMHSATILKDDLSLCVASAHKPPCRSRSTQPRHDDAPHDVLILVPSVMQEGEFAWTVRDTDEETPFFFKCLQVDLAV